MVKRKSFAILILLFLLSGCAEKEYIYVDVPVYVEVPIIAYPEIDRIHKPFIPIEEIDENSSYKNVAEGYYNSIVIMKKYIEILETTLEPFYK